MTGFRLDARQRSPYNARMEPRLNFVTLVVTDLDRARRFYLDGLGWAAALEADGEVVMIVHARRVGLVSGPAMRQRRGRQRPGAHSCGS